MLIISHMCFELSFTLSEVVSSASTLKLEEYGCLELGRIELEGVIAKGYGVSFGSDENVPKLIVVIVPHICEYTKTVELTL